MIYEYYRQLFREGNNSIFWGGVTTNRYWDDGTLSLYIGIVLFVFIIGVIINKKQTDLHRVSAVYNNVTLKTINFLLLLVFMVLLIFLGFRQKTVGVDTIVYFNGLENNAAVDKHSTVEPLFVIVQQFLHSIFNKAAIGIFIYSFVTIYLIYCGLKRYEEHISLFVSLIVFVCLYYFQSFNLLRLTLAASVLFYFFQYLVEEKYLRYSIVIIITALIHYSSLIMFFPLGFYVICKRNRLLAFICITCLILFIVSSSIILKDYLSMINRYSGYAHTINSEGQVGIMALFDYLPCLLMIGFILINSIKGRWADLMISFTYCAVAFRLLAYYITIAGRVHTHFMTLTMLLLPYWIYYLKKNNFSFYKYMMWICVLWCIVRLHVYLSGYLSLDGIMPYHFVWN